MKYAVFSFTDKGRALANKIVESAFCDSKVRFFTSKNQLENDLEYVTSCEAVIFIGAVGIAVRFISPLVKDKLTDPAVICIDEKGQFVIPLLSGHVGGGNELAWELSKKIGAIPVITTATDINETMAIDEFAKKNGLKIQNRDNIKKVSNGLLKGIPQNIVLCDDVLITGDESELDSQILGLVYRPIVVGMGLRKDKAFEEVEEFFLATLKEVDVDVKNVAAIASIDVKRDEKALQLLSEKYQIPLYFYTASELSAVDGEYEESLFVEATVGVSDVSARAAKAAGVRGKFILNKKKQNGMTISVFEKYRRITFEY